MLNSGCTHLWDIGEKGQELGYVRERKPNLHMWIGSSQVLQFAYQK